MSERYVVISSDCHAGLPCEEYRPYLDPKVIPQFEAFLAERQENRRMQLEMNAEYIERWEQENAEGLRGAFDPEQRDKELDADGVAAEVMFADADAITGLESPPFGAGLSAGQITDPELAFAGARAHNRWLAEFCAKNPVRRAGVALVPITSGVDRSIEEIEWAAAQPGIRGIMIPTLWHDHPPYNDPHYDRVWAACQDTGMVVHVHSGEADFEAYNDHIGIYVNEVPFWTVRPLFHLLLSGKFEQFPGLKFVVTESGAYWAEDLLWKADVNFGGGHTMKKLAAKIAGTLTKLPSEYFGVNCFIGASTMSKHELRQRYATGIDATMWGTDYPHPEGTWPHTRDRLKKDFADLPVDDTAKLLGLNAARCYGMDLDALQVIADKIGPSADELGQDPNRRSDPDEVRRGRWWIEEYDCRMGS
jgi:predicted TIM-barrel fold metal-dependent hydrolase